MCCDLPLNEGKTTDSALIQGHRCGKPWALKTVKCAFRWLMTESFGKFFHIHNYLWKIRRRVIWSEMYLNTSYLLLRFPLATNRKVPHKTYKIHFSISIIITLVFRILYIYVVSVKQQVYCVGEVDSCLTLRIVNMLFRQGTSQNWLVCRSRWVRLFDKCL